MYWNYATQFIKNNECLCKLYPGSPYRWNTCNYRVCVVSSVHTLTHRTIVILWEGRHTAVRALRFNWIDILLIIIYYYSVILSYIIQTISSIFLRNEYLVAFLNNIDYYLALERNKFRLHWLINYINLLRHIMTEKWQPDTYKVKTIET